MQKKLANKKAQVKIQEMAFVLVAIVILGGIVFIFFSKFQLANVQKAAETVKQKEAISLLERISAMPEIKCAERGVEKFCIDQDKLEIFIPMAASSAYIKQWQGMQKVSISNIWPDEKEWTIYGKWQGNFTYSTFINVCKQEFKEASSWTCSLALMEISYS